MLEENLQSRHNTLPVHSIQEISYLKQQFRQHITVCLCYAENNLYAGAVLYTLGKGIHTQYIASSPIGRQHGSVDFLINKLIHKYRTKKAFLSFGTSHAENGLNLGLLHWKEGFRVESYCLDTYRIPIWK